MGDSEGGAQKIMALATKPDNLGSIPRTYPVEGKSHSSKLSFDLYTPDSAHTKLLNKFKKINGLER